MKFIHCADVHLGAKMESRLPKDKADERKSELRQAFRKMVKYASDNGIEVIALSGDVFDTDCPRQTDKSFFYSVVRGNPSIDFLYLRGNHDNMASYTEDDLKNLKTFSDEWSSYRYDNVRFFGLELRENNTLSLYSTLKTDKNNFNVVLLHGQIAETSGGENINLRMLRAKNIDYLALGHIHTHTVGKLDERGKYAYSGCLEGRGFDECGKKGFFVVDTDTLQVEFIENSVRTVEEIQIDLSDTEDLYTAITAAERAIAGHGQDLVRLVLTGEIDYDGEGLERELERQLASACYFLSVKNHTLRRFHLEELKGDISLHGEFIRTVLQSSQYSDEQKQQILSVGLNALSGREVK